PCSLIAFIEAGLYCVSARLDKNTGAMLNAWRFNLNSGGQAFDRLLSYDGHRILYAGNRSTDFFMSRFDTLGMPVVMKHFADSSGYRTGDVLSGEFVATYTYYNMVSNGYKNVIFKVDTSLQFVFVNE